MGLPDPTTGQEVAPGIWAYQDGSGSPLHLPYSPDAIAQIQAAQAAPAPDVANPGPVPQAPPHLTASIAPTPPVLTATVSPTPTLTASVAPTPTDGGAPTVLTPSVAPTPAPEVDGGGVMPAAVAPRTYGPLVLTPFGEAIRKALNAGASTAKEGLEAGASAVKNALHPPDSLPQPSTGTVVSAKDGTAMVPAPSTPHGAVVSLQNGQAEIQTSSGHTLMLSADQAQRMVDDGSLSGGDVLPRTQPAPEADTKALARNALHPPDSLPQHAPAAVPAPSTPHGAVVSLQNGQAEIQTSSGHTLVLSADQAQRMVDDGSLSGGDVLPRTQPAPYKADPSTYGPSPAPAPAGAPEAMVANYADAGGPLPGAGDGVDPKTLVSMAPAVTPTGAPAPAATSKSAAPAAGGKKADAGWGPSEEPLSDVVGDKMAGKMDEVSAQKAQNNALAAQMDANGKEQENSLARYQTQRAGVDARANQVIDQYQKMANEQINTHIDPNHWWNSKSTGDKVLASIGTLLTSFGNGAMGKSTDVVGDLIKEDVKNQQQNYENASHAHDKRLAAQNNLYGMLRERGADADTAYKIVNKSLTDIAANKIAAIASRTNNPIIAAQGQQAIADLQMKGMQDEQEMRLKHAQTARVQLDNQQIVNALKLQVPQIILSQNMEKMLRDNPDEAMRQAQASLTGPTINQGGLEVPAGPLKGTEAMTLADVNAGATSAYDSLGHMIELTKQFGNGYLSPQAKNEYMAELENYVNKAKLAGGSIQAASVPTVNLLREALSNDGAWKAATVDLPKTLQLVRDAIRKDNMAYNGNMPHTGVPLPGPIRGAEIIAERKAALQRQQHQEPQS